MLKPLREFAAELIVSGTFIWIAAAVMAFVPSHFWIGLVVASVFFFQDRLVQWLFAKKVTHILLALAGAAIGYGISQNFMLANSEESMVLTLGVAALGGGLAWFVWNTPFPGAADPDADPNFVRGVRRERMERVRSRAERATLPGEATLTFGPILMPLLLAINNFLAVGAPGSGKTVLLYLMLKSFLPLIKPGSGKRAVIYDAKVEIRSRLRDLAYTGEVIITNFTDARAAGWKLGEDFREPHTIAEAAELLFPVPTTGHTHVFFDVAVRDLAQGVMLSWSRRFPRCLTLRDLICSMEDETRLRQVLGWDMEANHSRLALYFGNRDTLQNILATIASKVEPYRAIAAFWHRAPHRFSLTEFCQSSAVLLLGRPTESQTAADNLNSLLLARLTQLLLAKENTDETDTFVSIDEAGKAPKIRLLDMLLLQGRSKGTRVWLGVQSIASLRATYGKDIAIDLTAGCGNVAVLALAEADSAQWAEETWGRQERWERSYGHSSTRGPNGGSSTSSEHFNLVQKPTVLASEFLALRPPSKRTGKPLAGFYKLPGIGSFKADIALDDLAKLVPDTTARGAGSDPDHIRAPWHHGILHRWTEEELRILGLPQDDAGLPPRPEEWPDSVGGKRPRRPRPTPTDNPPSLDDIPNIFGRKTRR